MNNPGILSRWLSTQKRNTFHLEDLEVILDLLPQAAILVDLVTLRILLANATATEITAYSRSELIGMDLEKMLTCQDEDASIREMLLFNGFLSDHPLLIATRNGSKTNILASSIAFPNAQWSLITFDTAQERLQRQIEKQRNNLLWQHLGQLAQALQSDELQNALKSILAIACETVSADIAAIYQADGENLELVRIVTYGEAAFLPEKTSLQDLINITENPIWLRRSHPTTALQNLARRSGFMYLACAPLGQSFARVGMIVLAGRTPPARILSEVLPDVASFATAALDTLMRIANLKAQMRDQAVEISLSNRLRDLIQDNLILLNSDLCIIEINQAAEGSLGYSAREALNKPIEKILISSERLEELFELALKGHDISVIEDVHLFRRNGEPFTARLRITPVEVAHSGSGIAILFQDLSEREKIRRENEILEQRAVLGEVTASFAHEVRNPINNISTGLQLLEMNLPPDDPNQENIKRLQQDCNRLTALVKSGLSFVRPMEYKMGLVHVGDMLENLISSWKHRLERANIQYQVQIEPGLAQVEGDLRALEQVFTNLINNAFEAMVNNPDERPKLLGIKARRVAMTNGADQLQVSISDTGMGIPDDIRERIFEPFFTTKPGGTGIGLAIVKRIVTAHKGSISVESIPGGTIFQVQLPLYREKTQPILETAS